MKVQHRNWVLRIAAGISTAASAAGRRRDRAGRATSGSHAGTKSLLRRASELQWKARSRPKKHRHQPLNLKELLQSVLQEPIQQPYNTDEKDTDGIEKPACLEVAEIQFETLTVELALMLHSTYP